jgi:predicted ArsR family transcriptional regulator
MKSSRLQIIDYLHEHRVATSSDLSRILHLTSADVRHHLSQLSKQGSIITLGQRLTRQRGRPAKLYALSEPMSRNNLDLLAHHLLVQISSQYSISDYQQQLRNIAIRFASGSERDTSNITRRIYGAIKYLKDLNYDASWEAHSRSPRLILGHCPFAAILDQHPDICLLDAYLLEILVDRPVQQIEKLSTATRDLPYCVFVLQETNA